MVESSSDVAEMTSRIEHKDTKIISFDIVTHDNLSKLGIAHEKIEDYLNPEDERLIDQIALSKCMSWYKENKISSYLTYENIELGWLIENEMPPLMLHVMKYFVGIIRIINKEKPSVIITSDFLGTMIKSIDKDNKISIQLLESKHSTMNNLDRVMFPFNIRGKTFALWIPTKFAFKIARLVEQLISHVYQFKFDFNNDVNEEIILLLNINPKPYENLLRHISSLKKRIVLLYDHGAAVWNWTNLTIVKDIGLKTLELRNFLTPKLQSEIMRKQEELENNIRNIMQSDVLEEIFSIEDYSFWPSLKQQFTSLCLKRFNGAIERYELSKIMFSKMKIKCILSLYNPNPTEKVILHVAKESKIPGIVLQHGYYILGEYTKKILPILFPPLQRGLKHALWGQKMKDFLQKFNALDKEDILLSGNPRYDQYFKIKQSCKNDGTILIASSFLQNYYEVSRFDTNLTLLHQKMFEELCKISDSIEGKKLVIKIHPAVIPPYDVRTIVREINKSIPIYKTQSVVDVMKDCDVLVSMDHSTILLEAMILDKPTITFAINSKWYEDDEIIQSGATALVRTPEEFEIILKRVLSDTQFRNDLIVRGRKFVNEYLANQGHSSDFIAEILEN